MELMLTNCEKQLSENDIEKVEHELSIKLPTPFKQHYLKFNGGIVPDETTWKDPIGVSEQIEIRCFISMLYNKAFKNNQEFTLNGRTLEEWEKGELPLNLIQFAMDWHGNYICLDHNDGKIYYFSRDVDENIGNAENLQMNAKLIANSFAHFMNSISVEDEISIPVKKISSAKKKNKKNLTIKSLVKKIETHVSNIAEGEELDYYKQYKKVKGATDKEMQALENEWDIKLPEQFIELYKYKNGSKYPFEMFYTTFNNLCTMPFYTLSIDEITKTKTYFCNEDKLMIDCDDFFSTEDIKSLDNKIKPYISHKQWIPFAQMVGGSLYLMMDFNPTEQGCMGQIIAYAHDPDFIHYVCSDIRGLLNNTITNLEDGSYEELH